MSKVLTLHLPLPVSVNHYLGRRISRGRGKKFITTFKTQEAILFEKIAKAKIIEEVKKQNWKMPDITDFIRVEAIWYISKKGIDPANLHKQSLDIMQGLVYHNDNMVLETTSDYFIDSKNPRCIIKVSISEKKGVFRNDTERKKFCEANCHKCSKKKLSCSFYKRLLENRIIAEVDLENNICTKIKTKNKQV